MNQSEVMAVLEKIQTEYDVTRLKHKNKYAWPVIRYFVALVLMKSSHKEVVSESTVEIGAAENNRSSKLKFLLSVLKYPALLLKSKLIKDAFNKLDARVVFISPSFEAYPDKVDNKRYSRYLDPYFEMVQKKNKVAKVQFVTGNQVFDDVFVPVHKVEQDTLMLRIHIEEKIKRFFNRKANQETDSFYKELERINNYVKENKINYEFNNWLIDELNEINRHETMFYDLFKSSTIHTVFFEGYYSMWMFGLISACKKLSIKTVDIQHGVVDINYLAWNFADKKIANYLPEYFWVWSKSDEKKVLEQNPTGFIKPLLGGNMWLKKFKDKKETAVDKNIGGASFTKYEKRILVSLQYSFYLDQVLELITEAIKQTTENYLWMFRIHPLNSEEEKLKVARLTENYRNTDYKIASASSLYELFSIADVHIVASSTVALEGMQFSIPTIIIHSHGGELYKDLVQKKVFAYADKPEEILKQIKIIKPTEPLEEYKIETSEQSAFNSLDNLFAGNYKVAS